MNRQDPAKAPARARDSVSKYAVESRADALRIELRPWGISVSLIEPGPIPTDMWGDALVDYDRMISQLSPEHRELYASHLAGTRTLLGRMQKLAGDPKKVVAAVDRALTSVTPTAINDAVLAAAATSR